MKITSSRVRVAVIDDERIIADTLAEILKLHGYEAKPHYNGESALVDAGEFRPDVVLSDIQMGKIDGIETALRIREAQPQCRIILFTAPPVRQELYQKIDDLGFEFLQRPLQPREVLALLGYRPE
jgi:DNA-binding response OmpR family regulator